jgi:hypothetical protein
LRGKVGRRRRETPLTNKRYEASLENTWFRRPFAWGIGHLIASANAPGADDGLANLNQI